MVNAARKYKRVTQVGTQQRSMPINNWASDLVKNGAIGKIRAVLAPNFVGPFRWTKTSSADVKEPVEPLVGHLDQPGRAAALRSRSCSAAGPAGGTTTAADCASASPAGAPTPTTRSTAPWAPTTPGPVEVLLEEPVADRETGKFVGRETVGGVVIGDTGDDDTGTGYHGMAKLTGPRAKVRMKFASGTELRLHLDGDRGPGLGAIFVGEKGKIEINRNKLASNPKELVRVARQPRPQPAARNGLPHRELDRVHQEPRAVQRRHRDRPAGHHALLPGQHRPRRRPGRQDAEVGSRWPSDSPTATRATSCSTARGARATSCPTSAEPPRCDTRINSKCKSERVSGFRGYDGLNAHRIRFFYPAAPARHDLTAWGCRKRRIHDRMLLCSNAVR